MANCTKRHSNQKLVLMPERRLRSSKKQLRQTGEGLEAEVSESSEYSEVSQSHRE